MRTWFDISYGFFFFDKHISYGLKPPFYNLNICSLFIYLKVYKGIYLHWFVYLFTWIWNSTRKGVKDRFDIHIYIKLKSYMIKFLEKLDS